ncbi:MAG TPA: DinB family protein, partial [Bacteroidota bacterium]|nr:DinB family protein [Bacteroidota bacterium]
MVSIPKWFERKFDFGFPVKMFPCILERLRGTPSRLEELANSFSKETLTVRIGEKWSVQEHIGHLYDLDDLHEARIEDFITGAKTLRPADLKNRKTYEAGYNTKPVESILRGFRESRMRFAGKLERM